MHHWYLLATISYSSHFYLELLKKIFVVETKINLIGKFITLILVLFKHWPQFGWVQKTMFNICLLYTFNDASAWLSRIEHCMKESSYLSDSFHFFSSKKKKKKKRKKKRKNELHSWCIWPSGYVFYSLLLKVWSGLVGSVVKNPPAMQETWVWTLGQEDPWRTKWQPTPVFLSGKSHGWRSLMGYSPWGCKESDMPEQLTLNDLDSLSVVKPHTPG